MMEVTRMLDAKSSVSIARRISTLVNNVSQSVVETNVGLMHSYAYKVAVIGDIEGNWEKLQKFADSSTILKIGPSLKYLEDDGAFNVKIEGETNKVVFLGDSIDKGPNNIKILKFFTYLKKTYGDRVILILGNRDVNKLRFNWELSDEALILNNPSNKFTDNRFRVAEWSTMFETFCKNNKECVVDGVPTEYKHGKNLESDRVLKLKFLLKNCMGSPNAFEDMKKELGNVPDVEVCSFYRKMVSPDGLLSNYLQAGQMAYIDEQTNSMFVHGGLSDDSLGFIPGQSVSVFEQITGKAPLTLSEDEYQKHLLTALEKQASFDLRKWVDDLNKWGQERISSGINGNMADALPIIRYQEPRVILDEKNRSTWKGNLPTTSSVIQGRPWNGNYNLSPVDEFTKKYLAKNGISKLFFGHSPIGQVPVIMCEPFPKTALAEGGIVGPAAEGAEFITVACDTSITDPKPRLGAVEVSKYGVTVRAFYYDKTSDKLIPVHAASWDRHCSYYSKNKNELPTKDLPPSWKVGTASDGKVLLATYKQAEIGGKKATFGVPEYSWGN